MTVPERLRRTIHFVPGANEKMLTRSLATAADSLVLDLEDAVTPERKDDARRIVCDWLRGVDFGRKEVVVRLNPLDSPWGYDDLRATMVHPPNAYLVPKARALSDLMDVDAEIARLEHEHEHREGAVRLIVVATETPLGVLNMRSFTQCERVCALTWGAEDLSAAIGARRSRDDSGQYLDVFKHCRVQTLLCANAGHVQPIDTIFTDIKDPDGLRRDCLEGAWMGFTGKVTIHPDQIDVVNEIFTPSVAEIAEAQELLEAFEAAQREGRMAFAHRGHMVDAPHLERARRLLERAQSASGEKRT